MYEVDGEIFMNWNAVIAITEIIGVITVVISLLYLAFQVRFARLAAADNSRTVRAIGVRENVLTLVNNSELRQNWLKSSGLDSEYEGLANEMNLSVDGAIQIDHMCQGYMWLHWGQYRSIKTAADQKELEHIISVFYSTPPLLACWKNSPYGRAVFHADFVKFVDNAIARCVNTRQKNTP